MAGSLGMRREELCGLKWENVSFQRQVIYVREARTAFGATVVQKETKNRSSVRTLYMPQEIVRLLCAEQERQRLEVPQPSGHVVLDHKGLPYSPNALSLAFTNQVLRPSADLRKLMQPEMSYERGYCRPECTKCSEVCPAGAIRPITDVYKRQTGDNTV